MQHTKIPLSETKSFSPFFLDYIQQKEILKPFYNLFPRLENFNNLLTKKSQAFPADNRKTLVSTLQRQYKNFTITEAVKNNIASLENQETFTVTTGHQLNIFTGPLYFIYKIVTVINTCKALQQKYPKHKFVPVYWMASEDHDYDEIKYFRLYGKKYTWETEQKGAVGRFNTREIKHLLNSIPGDINVFKNAYQKNDNLADAVRHYINELFGNEGVISLDADDHDLKSLFKKVIEDDVTKNATISIVEKTNQKLEKLGYKTQVFCRDINFFYLDKDLRSRIEKKEENYHVVDSALKFSENEIKELIDQSPEKFSPNVILRPLYQEMILPNVAYVGGPAEVIYWLQLKEVFDYFKTPFPILMPRNFAVVVDHTVNRKFEKTGLELITFFESKNYIFNHWVLRNTKHNLTVGPERTSVGAVFNLLKERAESIDKTLGPFVGAEGKRTIDSLEKIEKKLMRAEKRLYSDRLRQIEEVKDALFPDGSLQERTDNFLNFYQKDNQFITKLMRTFDPFDFNFNVLTYTS